MRLLRFLGLVATIAAVYFAQSIFDHQSLSQLLPTWLLNAYPPLYRFTRWLPADLFELSLWIVAFAAIGFGLLTPPWRMSAAELSRAPTFPYFFTPNGRRFVWWVARVCVILAIISASVELVYMWRTGSDSRQVQVAWAGAILVYLLGNIPVRRPNAKHAYWQSQTRRSGGTVYPTYHWVTLGLLLLITGALLSWPFQRVALVVNTYDAQIGLRAWAIANGTDKRLFTADQVMPPQLAVAPTALAMRLSGDLLLGTRLTSLFAGLLTIAATWLLGNEIFRRPLLLGYFGETIEDEGQWPALLAAALVATNVAVIHFSRLPLYLEPVGWGCISAWALLRGLRTGDRLAYALGGVLAGLAALLYPSGLPFLLIAPLWWVGAWLLRLTQPQLASRENAANSVRPNPMSWSGFFVWIGGVFVMLAPVIGLWLRLPALFLGRFTGTVWQNFGPALVTIFLSTNRNSLVSDPTHLIANSLAPLFLLAIGALLFNLDRLPGLLLFLWLISGLLIGNNLVKDVPVLANLLPIAPALALALAFTVDRIRITLLASLGTWLAQATTYLAVGVVAWVGFAAWVENYQFSRLNGDAASYTGYAIRALDATQPAVLLLGQQADIIQWQAPVVDFLTRNSPAARNHLTLTPDHWPASLPPHSRIIIQRDDQAWVAQVMNHYAGGQLTIQRDLHSNPVLYLYALP